MTAEEYDKRNGIDAVWSEVIARFFRDPRELAMLEAHAKASLEVPSRADHSYRRPSFDPLEITLEPHEYRRMDRDHDIGTAG